MENEHVISGLIRKRADLAGEIERTQHALRKLVMDLDAIDQAIRIFDPNADLGAIKPHSYPHKHAAFRGEMMRFVLDSLRTANGKPITTKEIALVVAKGRGLREDDAELLNTLRKRVGACIFKLKRDGVLREVEGTGDLKQWVLAGP